ncbi:MAG: 3' terminal RNA ribose 2'-O-methyltransferase Hen1, partial [Deltaproteobacteria bacterium]|nr:3' terminal RNA ribose 2'-O-methyltransferase Hen1 [Deltaproteobacteria bacterium]
NDRPYAASSFLSVAISRVFGSAISGKSSERPELAKTAIPLEATISVLPCRGGENFLRRLFEPLGYEVSTIRHALDPKFAEWGESPYFTVTLKRTAPLYELLTHLYVLIPVLDDEKHYWVGTDEVDKLIKKGVGWLETHPEKEIITLRYLKHRRSLARIALAGLLGEEELEQEEPEATGEDAIEEKLSLNEQRLKTVHSLLREMGAKRIIDLGCGEGKLLRHLLRDKHIEMVTGLDVSIQALERAKDRLQIENLRPKDQARIQLLHGSLMYRDKRLEGFDAATVVEVIEHLDQPRLAAFERVLFEFARPTIIVLTTPNREYNVKFENLPTGKFRHKDHRFEWTRGEFQAWAKSIAEKYGYIVEFKSLGEEDEKLGAPTQIGVFTR